MPNFEINDSQSLCSYTGSISCCNFWRDGGPTLPCVAGRHTRRLALSFMPVCHVHSILPQSHWMLVVVILNSNHCATLAAGQQLGEALQIYLTTLKLDFLGRRKGHMQVHIKTNILEILPKHIKSISRSPFLIFVPQNFDYDGQKENLKASIASANIGVSNVAR